jgi:hypothetical protein
MKKVISLLLVVIAIGLTGCSSIAVGYLENDSSAKMSASYYSLSATKEHKITVKDGESVKISTDIITKKGTIDVLIYKDKDNCDYEGHEIKTSSFTVTLSEPGDYTIKVVTHKHRGSYSFTW